jgi:hypothetical protein
MIIDRLSLSKNQPNKVNYRLNNLKTDKLRLMLHIVSYNSKEMSFEIENIFNIT